MSRLPVHQLGTEANPLDLGKAQAYHLPNWRNLSHPERLGVLRWVAESRGHDVGISRLAVDILRKAGVKPRQYEQQAAALLRWVQDPENVYYINEPSERLQDPLFTLKTKMGDCDDQVMLLCSLFTSIRLSWKLCLAGQYKPPGAEKGKKVVYIEGNPIPPHCVWSHVFCMVGTPPFKPKRWYFCETTVNGVPLGWDVIHGDKKHLPEGLPEMQERYKGPATIEGSLRDVDLGQASALIPLAIGIGVAEGVEMSGGGPYKTDFEEDGEGGALANINWGKVRLGILTGVVTAVGTTLALQWLNGEGMWRGYGPVMVRWGFWEAPPEEE